jgi:hypothetical protein
MHFILESMVLEVLPLFQVLCRTMDDFLKQVRTFDVLAIRQSLAKKASNADKKTVSFCS